MNWMDFIIIFILIMSIIKGIRKGFFLSLSGFISFILSIYLTKRYYPFVKGHIFDNPKIHEGLEKFFEWIINLIFFNKNKKDPNFIPEFLGKGIVDILITILCILVTYCVIKFLLNLIFKLINHIFKLPVLKQLNRVGGFFIGIIKGMFLVYIIFVILTPIVNIYPNGIIGKGISKSVFSEYFIDNNLIMDFLDISNHYL